MGQNGSTSERERLIPGKGNPDWDSKKNEWKKNDKQYEPNAWKEYSEKYSTNTYSAPASKGYDRLK